MVVLAVVGFVGVAALGGMKKVRQDVQAWCEKNLHDKDEKKDSKGVTQKDIENIRKELKGFDKDIWVAAERVSSEDREIGKLEKTIATYEGKLAATRAELDARAAVIKGASEQVKLGHRTLSVAEAKTELEADVQAFVRDQESVDALKSALAERRSKRDALDRHLKALQQQQQALTLRLHKLEADLALLNLERAQTNAPQADTRGAKVAELISEKEDAVAIERGARKLVTPPAAAPAAVPVKNDKDVDQIMAPLKGQPAKAVKPDTTKTGAQPIAPVD